jgi:hypothetical protein
MVATTLVRVTHFIRTITGHQKDAREEPSGSFAETSNGVFTRRKAQIVKGELFDKRPMPW